MHFSYDKITACAAVTVLLINTISATTAESICTNFDGKRESCEQQLGECFWDLEDSKCLHIFSWDDCAEKTTEIQCQQIGCTWNKDDESCFMSMDTMARPLFLDEDEEPPFHIDKDLTRPYFPDEDEETPSDIDRDIKPEQRPLFLDEDEEFPSDIDRDIKPEQRPLFLDKDEESPLDVDRDSDLSNNLEEEEFVTRPILMDEDEETPSDIDRHIKPEQRPLFLDEDEVDVDRDSDTSEFVQNQGFVTRPLFVDEDVEEDNDRSNIGVDEDLPQTRPIYIDEIFDEDIDEDVDEDFDEDEDVDEDVDEEGDEDFDEDIDEEVDEDEYLSGPIYIDEDIEEDNEKLDIEERESPLVVITQDFEDVPQEEEEEEEEEEDEDEDAVFWEKLTGLKVRLAKKKIKNRFGDKYTVFTCRKRNARQECYLKNRDGTRVRLWLKMNRRVKTVQFG